MPEIGSWTIVGADELAGQLRDATRYIEAPRPLTVATAPADLPPNAIVTGRALLVSGARSVISPLHGFRILEETARAVRAGEAGDVYGFFGSYRLERGTPAGQLRDLALVPLLTYALEIFSSTVERVMARRASLVAGDDAWFVTLRLTDETLLTIEAMATRPPGSGSQVLVEITGSEQVLRAEPTRQATIVERIGDHAVALPWWEDEAERLLQLIAQRPAEVRSAERLREAWTAVEQSLESRAAISA